MGHVRKKMAECLKAAVFLAAVALGFLVGINSTHEVRQAKAASSGELNIYGIYLSGGNGGDATLLESNGQFLLMDMGMGEGISQIITVLREQNVSKISLYISHYHSDHYGGSSTAVSAGIRALIAAGIYIETLYLPDPTLAKEIQASNIKKCKRLTNTVLAQSGEGKSPKVVQLKKGSRFQFGNVSAEVIGPIEGLTMADCGNKQSSYQNNYSLVTMMNSGGKKFFTAGDIQKEQESLLVAEYGGRLKADIMKLSHHGTASSNHKEILQYIRPVYSFGLNSNHTSITRNNHQETYGAQKRAFEYGICYMTGEEQKTIRIQAVDGKVFLYRYVNGISARMSGWVILQGGDGVNYKTDKFYLDENGCPLTGLQKINGRYYHFGNGGCMRIGHYNAQREYRPWVTFEDGIRYIYPDGHIAIGFLSANNRRYYFNEKGLKLNTTKDVELKKIEGKYYALIKGGIIYTGGGKGGFRKFPKGHRYFNAKGVMQTGWKKVNGARYYLDVKTGYRTAGFRKISGKTYYFKPNGQYKCRVDTSKVSKFKGSAGEKSISFSWKKNNKVNGYEVYISTQKGSGYKRKGKIASRSTTEYTVRKLSGKKTYYAKIRTYTTIGGKTCKGEFGKPIQIKLK